MSIKELAVQIDERLAELYDARFHHRHYQESAINEIRRTAGHKKDRWTGQWSGGTLTDAIAAVEAMPKYKQRAVEQYRFHSAQIAQIRQELAEGNDVWYEEGCWTRAFLVLNSNGHIHSSMECSTCFDSTRYEWLTAYSADDEATIVASAGETACTVCYPSAPAEILNRPSTIQSKVRAEKEAAAAARATAKAEREAKRKAKAPTASGEPLTVPQDEWGYDNATLNTEVTARKTWNGIQDRKTQGWGRPVTQQQIDAQALIEAALAGKYGVSPAEMRDQLFAKYAKRRAA